MATTHLWHDHLGAPASDDAVRVGSSAMDDSLVLVGRLIFGGYFLYSGIQHFMNTAAMAAFAAQKGVPMPYVAVMMSGALIVVGGLSLLTNIRPLWGAMLIVLFLVGVTPVMHAFWNDPAGPARQNDLVNFTKNLALIGGACLAGAIRR
jgi:putative oxidoreductase